MIRAMLVDVASHIDAGLGDTLEEQLMSWRSTAEL